MRKTENQSALDAVFNSIQGASLQQLGELVQALEK